MLVQDDCNLGNSDPLRRPLRTIPEPLQWRLIRNMGTPLHQGLMLKCKTSAIRPTVPTTHPPILRLGTHPQAL